jgi:hypothetical protein
MPSCKNANAAGNKHDPIAFVVPIHSFVRSFKGQQTRGCKNARRHHQLVKAFF